MHRKIGKITGKVKEILPDAQMTLSGHSTGMNLAKVLQRIDQRLRELNMSADKASRLAKKPDAIRNIRRAVKRGSGVNAATIAALAPTLKTSAAWLMGEGPVNQRPNKSNNDDADATIGLGAERDIELDEPEIVPEIDVNSGANYAGGFGQEENIIDEGGNAVSRDAIRANWGIPRPFLRDELRIPSGRAHILPVRGDSMQDALFDGDRAIINLDDLDVSQGGIFALLDDNASVIIKQVEMVRGSKARKIRCTSRNPVYEPFVLDLIDPVRIIGRVASKITRV